MAGLERPCIISTQGLNAKTAPGSNSINSKSRTTRAEHDEAQWVWRWTEASGKARPQSSTVGVWRRFKGHILYPL